MINENKMIGKTISQFLSWLESKKDMEWVYLDTETSGLQGPKKDQLTQVAALSTNYNFRSNSWSVISSFDKKIKLTDRTKQRMTTPDVKQLKWVLSFNHYGQKNRKYHEEGEVLNEFSQWLLRFKNPLLVIQNAAFDMKMINGRNDSKLMYEVFDTKMMIQLYYLPLLQKLAETDEHYKSVVSNIGTSDRDNGLISSSMSKIGPALGIDMTNYHDALKDVNITILMTQKIIQFLKDNKNVDISKYHAERVIVKR